MDDDLTFSRSVVYSCRAPLPSSTRPVRFHTSDTCPPLSQAIPGVGRLYHRSHIKGLSDDILMFESRFEGGNLQQATRIGPTAYDLHLRKYVGCGDRAFLSHFIGVTLKFTH